MTVLKIDQLLFCETLDEHSQAATQGGFSLNVYRGRRSFRKSIDVFGEVPEKQGENQGEKPLPNAPVVAPGEIAVLGTGVVSTIDGGRFSATSAGLNGSGGFSIGTSI